MRLFFAIDTPGSPILNDLYQNLKNIHKDIRPVDPSNHHLTLKFIGDPECSIQDVIGAVDQVKLDLDPIRIEISEFGAFPNWRRPTVAWLGFKGDEGIKEIARELDISLHRSIGTPLEMKGFKTHLTISRFKGKVPIDKVKITIQEAIEELKKDRFSIDVKGFDLISSTLGPKGPLYSIVRSFQFDE